MTIVFPPVMTGGAPPITAVNFTASTDKLERATALSGAGNSNECTMSFWFRPTGLDTSTQTIFSVGSSLYVQRIQSDDATTARRRVLSISSTPVFYYGRFALALNTWTHCLVSWRTSGSNILQAYFNDTVNTPQTLTLTTGTINFADTPSGLGRSPGGGPFLAGDVAEFWLTTSYIDLSVTDNRRKFIKADGKPAYLGPTGGRPTGSSPLIYLKGPATNWGTNSGTGGNFAVTGTFTDATPP